MVQITDGPNAYKDADGFLQIEDREFEQPAGALFGSVFTFSEAKERALEESRRRLLAQIHEANRRMVQAQEREASGVVMTRLIDGNPSLSLNDIKL